MRPTNGDIYKTADHVLHSDQPCLVNKEVETNGRTSCGSDRHIATIQYDEPFHFLPSLVSHHYLLTAFCDPTTGILSVRYFEIATKMAKGLEPCHLSPFD
jgi:hypothetical protein